VTQNADPRKRAYGAGAEITKDRMLREAPLDAEALSRIEAADVLVVPGIYDRVELVLGALETPYTSVEAGALLGVQLRPEQLVVVNCPGHLPGPAAGHLREFVAAGGSLFTTDWALRHVLEPAFPGVVAFNERPTRDDVVRIEIREHDNPFLEGVMDGADDPVWWLEGSSYPIRVLEQERVDTLIASAELEAKYGEAPVAVMFRHGQGEVFHMISHYYLQRTELRNRRHQQPATAYAAEKGVPLDAARSAEMADLKVGDVESAATSSRFLANVLAARKRRMEGSR
jgi:hypothetical protein